VGREKKGGDAGDYSGELGNSVMRRGTKYWITGVEEQIPLNRADITRGNTDNP